MNKRKLLLLLVLLNWTVYYAQTPGSRTDSLACYTTSEMRHITTALIEGKEAAAKLEVANQIIVQKDTTIASQDRTIVKQDLRYITTEHLVDECENDKILLKSDLEKANNKLKWTKVGWAATAVVLGITTIIGLIK